MAVDAAHQLILAAEVTSQAADAGHLPQMLDAIEATTARPVRRLTADAGYFSAANLATLQAKKIDAYIPPAKVKHTQPLPPAPRGRIPQGLSARDRMRRKLHTQAGRAVYRKHKGIAEPVLGQIKAARGFTRFLLRGLGKVKQEWQLVVVAHNICKLFQAGLRSEQLAVVR